MKGGSEIFVNSKAWTLSNEEEQALATVTGVATLLQICVQPTGSSSSEAPLKVAGRRPCWDSVQNMLLGVLLL